jgi:osmotically-inducible protein OsmY
MTVRRIVLAISTAMLINGCGPDTPEEKLENDAERVQEARSDVTSAADDVTSAVEELESRRKDVQDAELALARARKELRRVQSTLAKTRAQLDSSATDTSVFRFIQNALLNDPVLENAAVHAGVINGVVSLYGEVATKQQKARAEEIAAGAPGVADVRNFVDVGNDTDQNQ